MISILEKSEVLSMEKSEKIKIAEQARIYRAKTRLTQSELASLAGISQRVLSFLETEEWDKISESKIEAVRKVVCK